MNFEKLILFYNSCKIILALTVSLLSLKWFQNVAFKIGINTKMRANRKYVTNLY